MDDDPEVSAVIARILTNAGYATRDFNRVVDSEMALAQVSPQIIILDLSLGQSESYRGDQKFGGVAVRRVDLAHQRIVRPKNARSSASARLALWLDYAAIS